MSQTGHEYLEVPLLLQKVMVQCQSKNYLNALLYWVIMYVLLGLLYFSLFAFKLSESVASNFLCF